MKDLNVLYIDYEQENLNYFNSFFKDKYTILSSKSGVKGLELINNQVIDLVVIGLKIKYISVQEFLRKLKEKRPDVKCVFLKANHDFQSLEKSINEVRTEIEKEKERIWINQNLNVFLNNSLDAIITIDRKHKIRMVNPALIKLFGYSEEELLGSQLSMLIPENIRNHDQLINEFGASKKVSHMMGANNVLYGQSKSGKIIPIETNLTKIENDGKIFYNAIIRDVSKKLEAQNIIQKSEEEFRGIFDSMTDVFVRRTFEGEILLISPSIFYVTGFTSEEIVKEKSPVYFVDKELLNRISQKLLEVGGVQSFDSEIIKKDGSVITVTSNSKLFYDVDGNPIGIESVFRDITKNKNAEIKILDSQRKLKKLTSELIITEERMRKQIATDLHDDVGQLLASSRMQLGVIDFNGDLELIKKKVKDVSQSLLQATKATREVIFNLSPPQLNEIGLYAAIHDWMKEEIEKKHGIRTSITGDSAVLNINENTRFLLFRSFRELLFNVVKHANASLIKIKILDKNNLLTIIVKDDGKGFDYDLDKLSLQTMGYGLFSIEERISNLGGTMTIDSKRNLGSEIILTVPKD